MRCSRLEVSCEKSLVNLFRVNGQEHPPPQSSPYHAGDPPGYPSVYLERSAVSAKARPDACHGPQMARPDVGLIVSPFFARPDGTSQSPSGAKNWRHALPSAARVRPASATPGTPLRCAPRHGSHNDLTPCRLPYVLSPPALTPQTPTKHPALGLRGGRRTRSLRSTSVCSFAAPVGCAGAHRGTAVGLLRAPRTSE